jgi:hypothetical protein
MVAYLFCVTRAYVSEINFVWITKIDTRVNFLPPIPADIISGRVGYRGVDGTLVPDGGRVFVCSRVNH